MASALIRPRDIETLKKTLDITPRFTLCAECPHASWEATESDLDDNSNFTAEKITAFAPLVTDTLEVKNLRDQGAILTFFVHLACHCTAKGRFVAMPIRWCQTYEQAKAEAEA